MQVVDAEALDGRWTQQQCNLLQLTVLPQHLLELILVGKTSTQDKKALRQTCNLFHQLLDNSVTSIKLRSNTEDSKHIVKLLKRMHHWPCLRASEVIINRGPLTWLPKHVPGKLTTLILNCHDINLQHLAGLQCLRSLNISSYGCVTGLRYVSGLTRLYTDRPVGSLSHLAPTLKQLRTWQFTYVKDVDQLTNVEVLEVQQGLPSSFSKFWGKLPLKHLAVHASDFAAIVDNDQVQRFAPLTLTRLTLSHTCSQFPAALPASITHLQLLYPESNAVLVEVAAALPGLRSLDIYSNFVADLNHVTRHLSKLTALQSLGICVYALFQDTYRPLCLQQVILQLPEVAKAAEKGVTLTAFACLDDLKGVLHSIHIKSTWATHA